MAILTLLRDDGPKQYLFSKHYAEWRVNGNFFEGISLWGQYNYQHSAIFAQQQIRKYEKSVSCYHLPLILDKLFLDVLSKFSPFHSHPLHFCTRAKTICVKAMTHFSVWTHSFPFLGRAATVLSRGPKEWQHVSIYFHLL